MNIDTVFQYATNFLHSLVAMISSPLGVVVLGVAVCLIVVYFFEDLRR